MQSAVDELGCAFDVGAHGLVDLSGCSGPVECPERLELDTPESEQGGCCDLWLGVSCAHPGALSQPLGGHDDKPVQHVALIGAERRRGVDQVADASDRDRGAA
jgi:hypothetical protein